MLFRAANAARFGICRTVIKKPIAFSLWQQDYKKLTEQIQRVNIHCFHLCSLWLIWNNLALGIDRRNIWWKKSTNLYASDLPLMHCKAVGKGVRCPSVQFPHCCACLIKRKLANGRGQRHFNLLLHWPYFVESFNNIHCVTLLGQGQRLYMPFIYFIPLQNNALLHLVYMVQCILCIQILKGPNQFEG